MTQAPTTPRALSRLPELDSIRGVLLILMTLGHLELASDVLQKLHPAQVTYIDAAYGFVFLSGMMAGLVYGRIALKHGLTIARQRAARRAATLYLYAALLIAALTAAAMLSASAGAAWAGMLGPMVHPRPGAWIAGLLLIQHVDFADILPQYVVYLLLTPAVLAAGLTGRLHWALGFSALLWFAVQFGAAGPALQLLDVVLAGLAPGLHAPKMFNLLAWQLLFVWGCALGVEVVRSPGVNWRARAHLDSPRLLNVVLLGLGFLTVLRLVEHLGDFGLAFEAALEPLTSKNRLGVLALLELVGFVWLTAWLLLPSPPPAYPVGAFVRRLARATAASPALRLLGRHSLLVYVWHVLLVYAVRALIPDPDAVAEPLRSIDVIFVLALLFVPPLLKERAITPRLFQFRSRRDPSV